MIALCIAAALVQEPVAPSSLHPPSSLFYVEVPDVPAALEAYRSAPLVRLVQDDDVLAVVEDLTDSAGLDLEAMIAGAALEMGLPPEMAAAPLQAALGYLRRVSSFSLSVSFEVGPGETLEVAGRRLMECALELGQLHALLEARAADAEMGLPASLDELPAPEDLRTDPWGNPYAYEIDSAGGGFELRSLGADGEPGGSGAGTDIPWLAPDGLEEVMEAILMPRLGLLAVLEMGEEAHAQEVLEVLGRLGAQAGIEVERERRLELSGVSATLRSLPAEQLGGFPAWTMGAGPRVAVGVGTVKPGFLADRIAGKGRSTADDEGPAALQGHLSSGGATLIQGWTRLRGSLELLPRHPRLAVREHMVEALGETAWRVRLADGRFVSEAVTLGSGRLLGSTLGRATIPEGVWTFLPAESIGVFATSVDGSALYEEVLGAFHGDYGGADGPTMLSKLEERYGFELKRDVFESIGTGAAGYLLPLSFPPIPSGAVVVELADAKAFERGLNGLLALLEDQGSGEFQVRYRPYRDVPMWTFSFGQGQGAQLVPISPTLAIVSGHLLISPTSVVARRAIKRSIGEQVEAAFSATRLPPPGATSYAYLDCAGLINGLYKGLIGVATMMGGSADLPIDLAALPSDPAVFTRFFEPLVYWSRPIPGGSLSRLETSVGPEVLLGLAAVGAGFAWHQKSQGISPRGPQPPANVAVPDAGARQVTRQALGEIESALAVYRIELGRYPAELEGLQEPTANFPEGFLWVLPTDGWGRAFAYEASADGQTFLLWSLGPDGVDQRGGADDVASR